MPKEPRSPLEGLSVEDVLPFVEVAASAAVGEERVVPLARELATFLVAKPGTARRALEHGMGEALTAVILDVWDDPEAKLWLAAVTGYGEELPRFVNVTLVTELGHRLFGVLAELAWTLWSVGGLSVETVRHNLAQDASASSAPLH